MITVSVRTVGLLRALLGGGRLDFELAEGARVSDVLVALALRGGPQVASYVDAPVHSDARPPLRVQINGRDIEVLAGRETELRDGDDVLVLTPMAGG